MPKAECPACVTDPHTEPEVPHIHLTDYGYLLYTPDHQMRDYIEEIRTHERDHAVREVSKALLAEAREWRARNNTEAGCNWDVAAGWVIGWAKSRGWYDTTRPSPADQGEVT